MTTPNPPRRGHVTFVGAGPGAADLLTLRAAEALRQAEVVVHDMLVPEPLLDAVNPAARRVPIAREEGDGDPGAATGRLLVRLALEGHDVVRLKGGDPTVFARLAEEIQPLRAAGVPVTIVPGVTAALAAAAAAAVPLTSRAAASSLTLVTGHEADAKESPVDFHALAAVPGTLAIYMGVEQAARWARALLAAGKPGDTPVTVVGRCSWPGERIASGTLAECAAGLERDGWQSPAVVIVGAAVGPATGPLAGRRVLVTRPAGQGDELACLVRAAGGQCLHVPVIRLAAPPSWQPLDDALASAATYDWIVFASANGVQAFTGRLRAAGRDARLLGTARIAAIGPATRRALETAGLACDLTPDEFRSEGLAAAFAGQPRGGRFLLVRADKGRDVLRRSLEEAGHQVDEVAAYASRPLDALDDESQAAVAAGVDWVTVTSTSIAEATARLFADRIRGWRIASISPVTTAALRRAGLDVTVEADEASAAGLVAAMSRWESAAAARPAESSRSG
jgi:uroporphyrinogen III methyltransferase/synthase